MKKYDEKYIKRCFELAAKGAGYVSPNPLVGCVIVKEGKIVSEGWHAKFGGPHAEADAIAGAAESLEGAELYCNLEPCSHTNKKTPPCAPAIIESKIKRVVISNIDPNPFVSGNGIELLRKNGIEVETGILEEEGNYLNRFFFKYIKTGLPYVTLKIAQSADGMITAEEGKQTWLTGSESAQFVHRQRALYDAVLVGANTVNIDDPQLNVRLAEGRNPKRIIIDGALSSNPGSKVFNDENRENTILFTSYSADNAKVQLLHDKGVSIIRCEVNPEGKISFMEILKKLGEEKIASVFVEGGAQIFTQFIKENLFDELILLQSPLVLGRGVKALNAEFPSKLKKIEENMLGKDKKCVYFNPFQSRN
jgi:diaminohydroxyphosphoribosylaminopyrimidine deaminase/5-amino-6-(5-phosphoribosylamino)uracil reductase